MPQEQGDIKQGQDIDHQIFGQVGNVIVGDEVEEEENKENSHQDEEGAGRVAQGGSPLRRAKA